jgi:hypothetical protein
LRTLSSDNDCSRVGGAAARDDENRPREKRRRAERMENP